MDEIMTDRQLNQSHCSSTTAQKRPKAGLNLRAHREDQLSGNKQPKGQIRLLSRPNSGGTVRNSRRGELKGLVGKGMIGPVAADDETKQANPADAINLVQLRSFLST